MTSEGATFCAGACAKLVNRGVRDTFIVCFDSLTRFADAMRCAQTSVQRTIGGQPTMLNRQCSQDFGGEFDPRVSGDPSADDARAPRVEVHTFGPSVRGRCWGCRRS